MPNPTQATPEMVEQIGNLEEVELTKDGVRPLTPENQVATSVPASTTVGAPVETTIPAPDTTNPPQPTPALEPTATPAPTPTLVQTPPAIEVIPGAPPNAAPAATKEGTAPAAPAETSAEPAPKAGATEAEQLQGLVDYGAAQAEEARRAAQGAADRRTAQLDRQLEESKATAKKQADNIRELQMRELTDEEKEVARAKFAQDDERDELNDYRQELVDFHRTVYIDSLSFEFSKYGVTRESLQEIATPEEMELSCERAKSSHLGNQLSTNGASEVAPATVAKPAASPAVETPPAPPAPTAAAAVANVPAGATAPSDIGSGQAPPEVTAFDDSQSDGALQKNLSNMTWDTVRLPRS